ncbi:hypothetical protein SSPNP10_15905 [Streptomyces sp. NP10]|uniref:hypothetical protein n=1 Tax=Streptomyces sp. NP10 TaxID=1141731 RepID=UPI000F88B6A2|nr:hypothetical protein [Streptomyces sp. NP10]RUP66746.1 hypothetical protein SSPNP10_15905 [Streptomyces sp. NP10]
MGDTFGGEYRRPDNSGIGPSKRVLQDRASFDCAPRAGVGCLLALPASLLFWAGIIAAAREILGVVA